MKPIMGVKLFIKNKNIKMNIKKLEKATKVYEQIKLLDSQIIEIDKFAMLVANGETKSSFELKCEDLGKKEEDKEKEKVGFDPDGSLIKGNTEEKYTIFSWMTNPFPSYTVKKNCNEILLKNELSINAVMSILGVLLYEKQAQRQVLLNQLQSIGVVV